MNKKIDIYKSDIYPESAICHNDWNKRSLSIQLNITIIVDKDRNKVIVDNDQDDWNGYINDDTREVIHLYPPGRIYNETLKYLEG